MSQEEEQELAIAQYRRMKAQGKIMGNSKLMKPEYIRWIVAVREAIEKECIDVMPFDNREGGDGAYKMELIISDLVNARLKEGGFDPCGPNVIARELRKIRDAVILARKYPDPSRS